MPLYGYRATRGGKQLTVHPEEAAVVCRVFNLRRSGLTMYAIAARLNAEGIPTREGKRWAHTQVGHILTRGPVYRGGSTATPASNPRRPCSRRSWPERAAALKTAS